jgi:phosphonate transport system substrate-binding protein
LFASRAAPLWGAILTGLISGCDQPPKNPGPEYGAAPAVPVISAYRFAVHPLHNPVKLTQAYQPLMEWLNGNKPGARFSLEASRDYANFEGKYRAGTPEFILSNPWQTLDAMKHGYRVIAMAGEPEDFKGLILVRQDSGITQPADLKGKAVSYPSPTALAACIMPQYFLHRQGLDINRDIENRYVGSQESSILNVHAKMTAGGATWPPPWRDFQKTHPAEAAQLRVAWETEPLINNAVMVRDDIPAEIATRVQKLLAGLPNTAPGRALLAGLETARFIPATDQDYAIVRAYVDRFEQEVRKVETK